jgi:prepilin-type N-terminal cleavage/methylation domain-containing protein
MQLKPLNGFRYQVRGFSLIELMIAMVAGLVVSGAAIALIVAIIKSNAETIRATRLTQELRTTAEVIARDLRRARSVQDPIANIGIASTSMVKACNAISPASTDPTPSGTCITYAYDCTSATAGKFQAVGLAGNKVRIATSSSATPACPTASTGTQLSSDIINITGLKFTAVRDDDYTIEVQGKFLNDPNNTVRKITQEVRVRSAQVN